MSQLVRIVLLLGGLGVALTAYGEYPDRPIKLVVPFGPGGGTDSFARAIKLAIDEHGLLPQPLVIVNIGGAGATIGSRHVKNAEPDGYTILLLHEAIITARYSGQAEYGSEAFEPIAATGQIGLVVAVADQSRYQNLEQLLEAARERPDRLVFAANLGAPVHYVGAMLEQHYPGARFRYTQTGGGEKRLHALVGGHAQVSAFSLEEYLRYKPAGVRALAYLDDVRHPAEPELPTTFEQGIPARHINVQFWWAPRGTPSDRIERLADALERAMQTDEIRQRLADMHWDPIFLRGPAMAAEIAQRQQTISQITLRETEDLPNVPLYVGLVIGALVISLTRPTVRHLMRHPTSGGSRRRRGIRAASFCSLLTLAYVTSLSALEQAFVPATMLYVVACGGVLTGGSRRHWWPLALSAIVLSLGLSFVFTRVFSLVLP